MDFRTACRLDRDCAFVDDRYDGSRPVAQLKRCCRHVYDLLEQSLGRIVITCFIGILRLLEYSNACFRLLLFLLVLDALCISTHGHCQ